jgi:radical SAM superfamily enzyme
MYKPFIDWFYTNRDNEEVNLIIEFTNDGVPLYITQHNVEVYFKYRVVDFCGQRKYIKRIFNALQFYASTLRIHRIVPNNP